MASGVFMDAFFGRVGIAGVGFTNGEMRYPPDNIQFLKTDDTSSFF